MRLTRTDKQVTGLKIDIPKRLLQLWCKHLGKISDDPITVGQRIRGQKYWSHCSACNKRFYE